MTDFSTKRRPPITVTSGQSLVAVGQAVHEAGVALPQDLGCQFLDLLPAQLLQIDDRGDLIQVEPPWMRRECTAS